MLVYLETYHFNIFFIMWVSNISAVLKGVNKGRKKPIFEILEKNILLATKLLSPIDDEFKSVLKKINFNQF